ncbi:MULTISPECIES: DNA -binding domain-containing protein [Xanthobacteraceae]|uniref:DNA -binding domain-containing protein n=1 Tax=Xanthobacteraceae TaxID=335928 RepID=UPI002FBD86A3
MDVAKALEDKAPSGQELTAYDRMHIKLYMRLLDATADGADWREIVTILFGIDPTQEPDRARAVHDSHLARARWLAESGYRDLLSQRLN